MSTAEAIWKNLMTRFKQDDASRIFEIEQRLSNIQQGSVDISTYYTELVTLWEEHQNYVDLPVCTCGKCECNTVVSWEKLQQRSRVTKFLMGLNESFDATRRHILMLKPIPSMEEVFNMVAQDERQKTIKLPTKIDNVVFQNSISPHTSTEAYTSPTDNLAYAAVQYRSKQRPVFTHCGLVGHIVQMCFKLHGYPPGHRLYNASNGASERPGQASSSRGQSQPSQHFVNPKGNSVANVTSGASIDMSQFIQEQICHLLQQLQSHVLVSEPTVNFASTSASITDNGVMATESSCGTVPFPSSNLRFENNTLTFNHHTLTSLSKTFSSGTWIIDSGATTHVCSDLALFSSTSSVSGVTVTLPNGTREQITHVGTVHISDVLILCDVLYVPSFQFNLLSVSSLLKRDKCSAHFYVYSCFLRDHTQALMIGKGFLQQNLYVLDIGVSATSNAFCGSLHVDEDLWHQRLGHPLPAKLQSLSSLLSLSKFSLSTSSHCHVCPLAKQKRLPFVSNNNFSENPFDLIHIDIWGPFSVGLLRVFVTFLRWLMIVLV